MFKKHAAFVFLCAVALAVPALAQQTGNVAELNIHTPKPGSTDKYEAARKKHMAWHKAQKDTWTWNTWEVVSGPDSGTYYTGSFGHAWKDFDGHEKFQKDDSTDFEKGIGPTLARSFTSYYARRADMSLTAPNTDPPSACQPADLLPHQVRGSERLRRGGEEDQRGDQEDQLRGRASAWYQLVNGGEGPMFILAGGGRTNWASFAPTTRPSTR